MKTVTWTHFFKNATLSGDFVKTLASRLRVHGRERRFLNTMMSYIMYTTSITLSLWAMLCLISIVLAFASEDGRKRLEYATCGRVFFTGPNSYLPPINCSKVFLTVEHTAVVGAEILKEKETTWSTNMTKKHKNIHLWTNFTHLMSEQGLNSADFCVTTQFIVTATLLAYRILFRRHERHNNVWNESANTFRSRIVIAEKNIHFKKPKQKMWPYYGWIQAWWLSSY